MTRTNQNVKRGLAGTAAAIAIATPFLIGWEGNEPVARHDPIDPPGVITACNGITNYDLPGLKAGMRFTDDECFRLLKEHLPRYASAVDKCVTAEISNYTRASLYSGAYNLGPATVCKSSMVRKINAGDLQGGCDAFMLYVKANGKFVKGLQNRRRAERALCLQPDPPPVIDRAPAVMASAEPAPAPALTPAPKPIKEASAPAPPPAPGAAPAAPGGLWNWIKRIFA